MRRTTMLLGSFLLAILAIGCGDDGSTTGGTAGTAGTSGVAGTAGTGNVIIVTGGTSGAGGTSGTSGTSGTGGVVSCPMRDAGQIACSTDEDCGSQEYCVPFSSEPCPVISVCVQIGNPCSTSDDCHPDSVCEPDRHDELDPPLGACRPSWESGETYCNDSRDCGIASACESDSCVPRWIQASAPGGCPHGYINAAGVACIHVWVPCSTDAAADPLGQSCVDVDGDGDLEMVGDLNGEPCTNAACPNAGEVCQATIDPSVAECGRFGLCKDESDCADGDRCLDLWGDGEKECVPPTGSCLSNADCGAGQVCAVRRDTQALGCTPDA
ncbi:MAG: hypothetical protein R3A47_00170 [Polyangiales bacterium]